MSGTVRKLVSSTLLVASLMGGTSGDATAEEEAGTLAARGYVDEGRLRKDPNLDAQIIVTIHGQWVDINCWIDGGPNGFGSNRWFKAEYYEKTGYLTSRYVLGQLRDPDSVRALHGALHGALLAAVAKVRRGHFTATEIAELKHLAAGLLSAGHDHPLVDPMVAELGHVLRLRVMPAPAALDEVCTRLALLTQARLPAAEPPAQRDARGSASLRAGPRTGSMVVEDGAGEVATGLPVVRTGRRLPARKSFEQDSTLYSTLRATNGHCRNRFRPPECVVWHRCATPGRSRPTDRFVHFGRTRRPCGRAEPCAGER